MTIHPDNPFATPIELRDPVRRLRGRLASGVTVVTAGDGDERVGLTVSSIIVAEGDPPLVAVLVGAGAELTEVATHKEAFSVHVLSSGQRGLAEVFAGLRPAPGGAFRSALSTPTAWGPKLDDVGDWAGCRLTELRPIGDQYLLIGMVEQVEVSDLTDPLIHFRGSFGGLRR